MQLLLFYLLNRDDDDDQLFIVQLKVAIVVCAKWVYVFVKNKIHPNGSLIFQVLNFKIGLTESEVFYNSLRCCRWK